MLVLARSLLACLCFHWLSWSRELEWDISTGVKQKPLGRELPLSEGHFCPGCEKPPGVEHQLTPHSPTSHRGSAHSRQLFPSRARMREVHSSSSDASQLQLHRAKQSLLVGVVPWNLHEPGHCPPPLDYFLGKTVEGTPFWHGWDDVRWGPWRRLPFICGNASEHIHVFTCSPLVLLLWSSVSIQHTGVCSST